MEKLIIWKTTDNRQFYSEEAANDHEELLEFFNFIKEIICEERHCKSCKFDYTMEDANIVMKFDSDCDNHEAMYHILKDYKYVKNFFNQKFIKESQNNKVFKQDCDNMKTYKAHNSSGEGN